MSGLFAAAMFSLDSGVNSITAVVMRDFLERLNLGPKTDAGHYRIARRMAFGVGAILVGWELIHETRSWELHRSDR